MFFVKLLYPDKYLEQLIDEYLYHLERLIKSKSAKEYIQSSKIITKILNDILKYLKSLYPEYDIQVIRIENYNISFKVKRQEKKYKVLWDIQKETITTY